MTDEDSNKDRGIPRIKIEPESTLKNYGAKKDVQKSEPKEEKSEPSIPADLRIKSESEDFKKGYKEGYNDSENKKPRRF